MKSVSRNFPSSPKLRATKLLMLVLWLFIFARVLLARTMEEILIESAFLAVAMAAGIYLVRTIQEEALRRKEIEMLAADLREANQRLTELDRQKSEFVSFATHQLRAPLTAMKGYASLILDGDLGKLSHKLRDAITRIYDSSNTLTNIVDDYLDISRIELGAMRYSFDIVELTELVDAVIGELKPTIEKSRLKFAFEVDREKKYMLSADRDKFKQIIVNLIDNSIKYTPVGSVTVLLRKKEDAAGDVHNRKILFSVKDTGIGIAKEAQPQLFNKFIRTEDGNRQNIYGAGLGLYIAKEIVDAHQGRIWGESEGEGRGAAFHVELEEVV